MIDFNAYAGLVGHGDTFDEDGYLLTGLSNAAGAGLGDLVGAVVDGADPFSCVNGACPTGNPSQYYSALDDGILYLEASNGSSFHIKSFDAGFMGNVPISEAASHAEVWIIGFVQAEVRVPLHTHLTGMLELEVQAVRAVEVVFHDDAVAHTETRYPRAGLRHHRNGLVPKINALEPRQRGRRNGGIPFGKK